MVESPGLSARQIFPLSISSLICFIKRRLSLYVVSQKVLSCLYINICLLLTTPHKHLEMLILLQRYIYNTLKVYSTKQLHDDNKYCGWLHALGSESNCHGYSNLSPMQVLRSVAIQCPAPKPGQPRRVSFFNSATSRYNCVWIRPPPPPPSTRLLKLPQLAGWLSFI